MSRYSTKLPRRYWYLHYSRDSIGEVYTQRDERNFVVRQNLHERSGYHGHWTGLQETSVLVNCCRRRHKVTLTTDGKLIFHEHPKGMSELQVMKQWGSGARLGCLDTKAAWIATIKNNDGEMRKRLPKPLQEASRNRRDLHDARSQFYRNVERKLDQAWPPVSEKWYSPVVVWSRTLRVAHLHDKETADRSFFGGHEAHVRLAQRARKLYTKMVSASSDKWQRNFTEPGAWSPSLERWWREVFSPGLSSAVYHGSGNRAPIWSATPIGNGAYAVLHGVGHNYGTRSDTAPQWGIAQWNGKQFVVTPQPTQASK